MLSPPYGKATGILRWSPLDWVLMAANTEQIRVLLIEDDDGDAFLVEELLHEGATGSRCSGPGSWPTPGS
jgi:hypothetical protein